MTTNPAPQSDEIDEASKFINIKKVINIYNTWIVSNFKSDLKSFESPMFSTVTNSEIKWRLKINKTEYDTWNRNYRYRETKATCSVQLLVESSDASKILVDLEIQILNSTPSATILFCKKQLQFSIGTYTDCMDITANDNILDPKNGYLQSNNIILTCQINIKEISKQLSISKCTAYENLDPIFENSKFSDVTLCVSGKEFKAHKVILASRSPIFSAMFDHDIEEKKHNRIEITDIDGEVFGELLRFVYTGKVLNLEKFAKDLLRAANKYQFENLKILCGKSLCSNISIQNAAELLLLTDRYGLNQLKEVAIGFIGAHVTDVMNTADWQLLKDIGSNLIVKVLCDVAEQLHGNLIF